MANHVAGEAVAVMECQAVAAPGKVHSVGACDTVSGQAAADAATAGDKTITGT